MVGIAFAPPSSIAPYAAALPDGVTVLTDPERIAYRALGLGRASWARAGLDPRVWLAYLGHFARGRRRPRYERGQDVLQLGADAVLDADLRVTWLYRSRGPEDRPPAGEVLAQLRRAAGR